MIAFKNILRLILLVVVLGIVIDAAVDDIRKQVNSEKADKIDKQIRDHKLQQEADRIMRKRLPLTGGIVYEI